MQIPWCQVLLWKNLWRTLRSESCVQSAGWNPTRSLATTLISCSTATHHSRNKLRGPTRPFRRYSLVSQRKHWSQAYWVLCSESPDFERHRRRPLLFWSPNRITRGFVSAQFSEGDLCTLPQVGNESFQRGSGEANMSHEEMAIILYPQHVVISSSLSEINLRIKYTVHQINIRTQRLPAESQHQFHPRPETPTLELCLVWGCVFHYPGNGWWIFGKMVNSEKRWIPLISWSIPQIVFFCEFPYLVNCLVNCS